jgi:putative endonuclease
MTRKQTGKHAETMAALALKGAGYVILDRNWRCGIGEIDLVAQHRDDIVFVEVRSSADGTDAALESITGRKSAKLHKLAHYYLATHALEGSAFRIDVVAVDLGANPPKIEIIENAVGW